MKNSGNFKQLNNSELESIKGGDGVQNGGDLIIVQMSVKKPLPKPKK